MAKTSFLQLVENMTRYKLLRTPFSLPQKLTYTRVYTVHHSVPRLNDLLCILQNRFVTDTFHVGHPGKDLT